MALNDDKSKVKKDIPLKDLIKKKRLTKVSETNQDFLDRPKKKIIIKKTKATPAAQNQKTEPVEQEIAEKDIKIVSSLEGRENQISSHHVRVGGIKNQVQDFMRKEEKIELPERKERAPKIKKENEVVIPLTTEKTEETVEEIRKKKAKEAKDKEKKDKKDDWQAKKKREEEDKFNRVLYQQKKPRVERVEKVQTVPKEIEILETISVGDLARKMNLKVSDIIGQLMKMGMMATINQTLDSDTATLVASEYGTDVKIINLYDETIIEHTKEDRKEDYIVRPPVVTIMGHVDHGKTKLLDAVRTTNMADFEAGGITQHIGAYQVVVHEKKITFLDTPGHEAFTMMRSRGASVTDIVILVVAADDGVMPQTIEAINHAKDAGVPIIVAINKIDKEGANPEKIKQELAGYELVPEMWGGSTIYVEISAKQKLNIEQLIEMILIQAEVLELKANPSAPARGTIIEAKLDQGRGPVATVLIQNGTLQVGDPFVAGIYYGKVRAIFNDRGEKMQRAYPADPVEIIGLTGVPEAGDPFEFVENERYAKQICQKRQELKRVEESKKIRKVTLEHLNEMIAQGEVKDFKIIIKSDVRGSAEALKTSLENLSNDQVSVKCIHTGTGAINESDIMLASASNAMIIGFHVRPNPKAYDMAAQENVDIKYYNIIYNAVDEVKGAMIGMLDPELRETSIGQGEIRDVFRISKVGTIAGAYVTSGKIHRNHRVRIIREGEILFDGTFRTMRRFKDDVSEVAAGYECGFSVEGFNDLEPGDTFETYEIKEYKQTR